MGQSTGGTARAGRGVSARNTIARARAEDARTQRHTTREFIAAAPDETIFLFRRRLSSEKPLVRDLIITFIKSRASDFLSHLIVCALRRKKFPDVSTWRHGTLDALTYECSL